MTMRAGLVAIQSNVELQNRCPTAYEGSCSRFLPKVERLVSCCTQLYLTTLPTQSTLPLGMTEKLRHFQLSSKGATKRVHHIAS